ncbi:unnamed protein product [Prunus armeniaca]
MADGSRTEAEQLNKSTKENSGEESTGERNEQELPQNKNSETWKIHRNEISSSEATEVGVFDFNNDYRAGYIDGLEARKGRNYDIKGNKIHSSKGQRVGIGKFGNNYSMSNVRIPYSASDMPFRWSDKCNRNKKKYEPHVEVAFPSPTSLAVA